MVYDDLHGKMGIRISYGMQTQNDLLKELADEILPIRRLSSSIVIPIVLKNIGNHQSSVFCRLNSGHMLDLDNGISTGLWNFPGPNPTSSSPYS